MGTVVVALDVGADRRPSLVEGLELLSPDAALAVTPLLVKSDETRDLIWLARTTNTGAGS